MNCIDIKIAVSCIDIMSAMICIDIMSANYQGQWLECFRAVSIWPRTCWNLE